MPNIKTEILGSLIELEYKEEEKDKLLLVINKFKDRLEELKHLEGKISDKKILFIAALKAEDAAVSSALVSESIKLKDENDKLKNIQQISLKEIDKIEKKINQLFKKIINTNNEDS